MKLFKLASISSFVVVLGAAQACGVKKNSQKTADSLSVKSEAQESVSKSLAQFVGDYEYNLENQVGEGLSIEACAGGIGIPTFRSAGELSAELGLPRNVLHIYPTEEGSNKFNFGYVSQLDQQEPTKDSIAVGKTKLGNGSLFTEVKKNVLSIEETTGPNLYDAAGLVFNTKLKVTITKLDTGDVLFTSQPTYNFVKKGALQKCLLKKVTL